MTRPTAARRAAFVAACAIAAAACSSDATTTADVRPVAISTLARPDTGTYAPSPDGRWIARRGPDINICLEPTSGATSEAVDESDHAVCSAADSGQLARWSPDSHHLVVGRQTFALLRAGPLVVLGVDGSETTIAEPETGPDDAGDEPEALAGAPVFPLFVDADTVAFARVRLEPPRLEWFTVTADDSDGTGAPRSVGEQLRPGGGDAPWFPSGGVFTDGASLVAQFRDHGAAGEFWSLELDTGDARPIPIDDAGGTVMFGPTDVSPTHLLAFADADEPGVALVDRASGAVTRIVGPDGPDDAVPSAQLAALDPSGRFVALALVAPLASSTSPSTTTIAIAPVESVVGGDPRWATLDTEIQGLPAGMLARSLPALRWDDPDHVLFSSTDALYSIELG